MICGFFCEWDKETKRDPRCIIKSISYRISTKLPDYRKLLLAKMEARASDYYEQLTASELFEQLITQPLSEMIDGNREKQIIVIDGLDETDENGENIFADILADNADKLPRWIGLLITSRPESNIKRAFAGFNPNEYDPASSFNYEDIKQYILKNLSDELAFTNYPDSIVSEMLNNCDGNFLYASLFVDAVKNGAINLSDKNTYPKGLNSIHFQNFKRKYPVRDDYSIPRKILEIIILFFLEALIASKTLSATAEAPSYIEAFVQSTIFDNIREILATTYRADALVFLTMLRETHIILDDFQFVSICRITNTLYNNIINHDFILVDCISPNKKTLK